MLWQYSQIVIAPIPRIAPRAFKERGRLAHEPMESARMSQRAAETWALLTFSMTLVLWASS